MNHFDHLGAPPFDLAPEGGFPRAFEPELDHGDVFAIGPRNPHERTLMRVFEATTLGIDGRDLHHADLLDPESKKEWVEAYRLQERMKVWFEGFLQRASIWSS